MTITGCTWVVGRVKRWDGKDKKYVQVPVHCNKIPADDSHLCPKHKLFQEHGEKESAETYIEGR